MKDKEEYHNVITKHIEQHQIDMVERVIYEVGQEDKSRSCKKKLKKRCIAEIC